MDPSHPSRPTTSSVSDKHDDRPYIEIVDESAYESLSNTTEAVRRSQRSGPYEELNNDVWKEIYPVNTKPTAAIQPQPSSAVSYQQNAKQIHIPISLKHNEISEVSSKTPSRPNYGNLVNKAPLVKPISQTFHPANNSCGGNSKALQFISKTNCQNPPNKFHSLPDSMNLKENKMSPPGGEADDCIDKYEYLSDDQLSLPVMKGEHGNIPISSSRPLPVAPLAIYEPLNRTSNSNSGKIVSRRTCIKFAKICLMLTVLVICVIATMVITMAVLKGKDGKPFLCS